MNKCVTVRERQREKEWGCGGGGDLKQEKVCGKEVGLQAGVCSVRRLSIL